MKTRTSELSGALATCQAIIALAVILAGCGRSPVATRQPAPPDPLAIILTPHIGDGRVNAEIRQRQDQIRAGRQPDTALERLGWLFVAKARDGFDAGFYKLAEQCALALELRQPRSAEALLLRGHVLQNLHRFRESELVARELVAVRGLAFDFGVLGDALMEQGKLNEAVEAYQTMADLKPDSQVATRAAHIRWLKGDLAGAIEMMGLAASAVSSRAAENAAWVYTRLASYQFQAGDFDEARGSCTSALELRPDYPPAMLLRGRMLLNEGNNAEAVEALRAAEKQNPLPEYQWALADALDAAGRGPEAREVEAKLLRQGASTDPRSFALFLATRGEKAELALRLAQEELATRADVFTHDAIAWAQFAKGNLTEAQKSMERSLAEGTQDARLFFHAAIIASLGGHPNEAENYFQKSRALAHLLLPSERKQLNTIAAPESRSRAVAASGADRNKSSAGGKSF